MFERARWHLTVGAGTLRVEVRGRRDDGTTGRGGDGTMGRGSVWSSIEETEGLVAELLRDAEPRPGPRVVDIRIEPPVLQRRELHDLPPVGPSALRSVVQHQAQRFFRQAGGRLVTDARWADGPTGRRAAVAVAVEESLLDALLAGAATAGVRVDSIRPALDGDAASLSLLPPSSRQARTARRRWLAGQIGMTAAALFVALSVVEGVRLDREQHALVLRRDSLAAPLAALEQLRREMDQARGMLDAVDGTEAQRLEVPARFLALVDALPDSVVLTAVSLDADGNGRISGLARRPLEVMARLERSEGVANPRLEGGTIREGIRGVPWERFTAAFGRGVGR